MVSPKFWGVPWSGYRAISIPAVLIITEVDLCLPGEFQRDIEAGIQIPSRVLFYESMNVLA